MPSKRGRARASRKRRRAALRSLTVSPIGGASQTEAGSTKPDRRFKGAPAERKATAGSARPMSALAPDTASGAKTLEALKSLVHVARRSPACAPLRFSDREADQYVERGPAASNRLQIIARHVLAAQQSGRLRSGDPELIAVIIVGAIVGASDMAQSGRVRAASGVSDLPSLPLVLIDRLALDRPN